MSIWLAVGLTWAAWGGDENLAMLPGQVTGLSGEEVSLCPPEDGALVMVFLWSACPISNRYAPRLNELAAEWKEKRVRFVGLYVDPMSAEADLIRHRKEYGLVMPMARDMGTRIARLLGVERVPCAVVLDGRRRVRYLGRIDDQFYALGRNRASARSHDLREAVDCVLEGRMIERDRTEVIGCDLPPP